MKDGVRIPIVLKKLCHCHVPPYLPSNSNEELSFVNIDESIGVNSSPKKLLYEQQHVTDHSSALLIPANVVCVTLAFIAV